tara:strand:- start:109 stop:873 length:765 start_codon:yes stop_codon:yes gene_type:complete
MHIHRYIQSLDLQIEERYRGDCPECNGSNTFTAIKTTENILYNCYKVGCKLRGNSSYQFTVSDALIRNKGSKGQKEIFALPTYVVPNMEIIMPWAAQYNVNADNLLYDVKENRIVFPVVHNNKIVDATGRAISKRHKPKWKRYGSSGHAYLSGYGKVAVVVEDCISAAVVSTIHNGFTGFALMGTSLLVVHIEELKNYNKVIVALDPDAVQKTLEFTRNLRGSLPTSNVCAIKLEDDLKYRRKEDIMRLELHIQ